MDRCPHCGSELDRPVDRYENRTNGRPGHKSTGAEFVHCPECGHLIDGFTSH